MAQTKRNSLIETFTNVFAGYLIGIALQMWVFSHFFGLQVEILAHFAIASLFLGAAIVRSYIIRRLFNKYTG